jgi:hypothetical protein
LTSVRAWLALALILPLGAWAQAGGAESDYGDVRRVDEAQVAVPEYPKSENYLPLQVSATTTFTFFVDAKSVSVGKDGVVRYTLIARSAEGVLNVSFEGIRCSARQFRVYALGRSDNTWSEARSSRWQPIPADARNAQRTVLHADYFCSKSRIIETTAEAVQALRSGPPKTVY